MEIRVNMIARFLKDESGATAIEYGLIAAAIGLMLVAVLPALRTALTTVYEGLSTGVGTVSP
jgi:pilus assembly protein Flp/PilA